MKKPIKYCKNTECEEAIEIYASRKRLYCSEYCRNRDGYLRRLEENKELIEINKGQKLNYKLLNRYARAGIFEEELSKLMKFEFNPKHLNVPKYYNINGRKCHCYSIKDIIFELNEENQVIIIHKSKHIKNERN
jgi:hypothetical protein